MASRKDIYKYANGFDKNPKNINRNGRPKKIYTILRESGFGKDDILTVFRELVWYTLPELDKIFKDSSKPAIIRITANQIYNAMQNNDMTKIKEIMQYTLGMPKQQIDSDVVVTKVNVLNLGDGIDPEIDNELGEDYKGCTDNE